ncbi:MAG TPA: hypothetical protein VFQ61_19395 [Polyangiaceae bacterium]|nr:hypothetical protein [Polyangiaceae bacterium]
MSSSTPRPHLTILEPAPAPSTPSPGMLAAALAGLMCISTACGSKDDEKANTEATVTSSRIEPDMTLEKFSEECTVRGGRVETHAHCGGLNTCRGFSYDTETLTLTEHTCKQLNTCAGYSCVLGS